MKPKVLREMTQEELKQQFLSLKGQLFNLRFQAKMGKIEKPSQIRTIRRDIARINTIFKERQNGQEAKQAKS